MFNNSNTRIFLQGNEDVARWHLPVVLSRFKAFVSRCKNSGLKQDRFTMSFEEDGTVVFGQYFYGEESIQLYSPFRSVVKEKSKDDSSVKVSPKTFWVNTTQGYFWVEVRYDAAGLPVVVLTQFEATKPAEDGISEEFIYPGMGMQSFGMLTGCIGGIPSQRYVLTQSGGVMLGEGEEKGTIKLPGTGGGNARITVGRNDNVGGFFCVLENDGGKIAQVKVISVDLLADELTVEMQHGVIDMLVEAEAGNITSENFPKTPTYIHRKCTGSYFSPNKTIGYHVDAGSDDDYHGNTFVIPPGAQDKLDNGMEGESYFNHSKDLYGIASLFATPIAFDEKTVSLVMVSPTLVWEADRFGLCWGGYGQTQTSAGCIDLQKDFKSNIISPRQCTVLLSLSSKTITVANLVYREVDLDSWCGTFGATAVAKNEFECGPEYFYESVEEDDIEEPCSWTEDKTGVCDSLTGVSYSIEYPREQLYRQHWVKNFKENITVKRKSEFRFGKRSLISNIEYRHTNPYFLFDGLWHLDFGVMYLSSPSRVESCGLCAWPPFSQNPGDLVYFHLSGTDKVEWILNNGHEYVKNLEVVAPLGMNMLGSAGGFSEGLGFIARVPESLEAPHEPEVLTGGVSYPSEDIEGEIVKCEYSLMSAPCTCDTPMQWGEFSSDISLGGTVSMYFTGGCPPFSWTGDHVEFVDSDGEKIDHETLKKTSGLYVKSTYECAGRVKVYEICGGSLEREKIITGQFGYIDGPSTLEIAHGADFSHTLGPDAVYTGTLSVHMMYENGANLYMPYGANYGDVYTVSWDGGTCSGSASMNVTCVCIPQDPPDTYFLVYPVNTGPTYVRAYNTTVHNDIWELEEGQYWVGFHPNYAYERAWIKYGQYVFGWYFYKGNCP